MEWYSTSHSELSIVAKILDHFEDELAEGEHHVELCITEPDVVIKQEIGLDYYSDVEHKETVMCIKQEKFIKQENFSGGGGDGSDSGSVSQTSAGFELLNCSMSSGQAMQFIDEKTKRAKKKRRKLTVRNPVQYTSQYVEYDDDEQCNINIVEGKEDEIFPVKMAARKVVNKQHFDKFRLNGAQDAFLSNGGVGSAADHSKIKTEPSDAEEGFVELCEVQDALGCSSVELVYGSGVSIYESVEACDSDSEANDASPVPNKAKTSSPFKCPKCSEQFTKKFDLMAHKTEVHKKAASVFKCHQCNAVYKRAYKFHCHVGGHDGRFSCNQCHRTFVRVTGFRKHLRQCHKISNPNICVVCGEYFLSQGILDDHLQDKHPTEAERLRAFYKQCSYCRYQFITELSYLNHIKNAPYKCNECDMNFECNNRLGFHLNFKHKPQMCHYCGKEFEAFDQYTYHVRYYHTDKHIKCPYCDEFFRVRSRLLIHIDVNHTEGHNYKCNHCDYTAKNYASVNRHRRIVHMPKSETHKNVCNICGKSFLVMSRLKVHLKSHSDAKPHVCKVCGRGYKFEYLLKRHQKNPDLCVRVLFPNGTRLERKGKRRCDMCDISFPSPEELALHMVDTHNVTIEPRDTNRKADGSVEQNEEEPPSSIQYVVDLKDDLCTNSENATENNLINSSIMKVVGQQSVQYARPSELITVSANGIADYPNYPSVLSSNYHVRAKPAMPFNTAMEPGGRPIIVDYVNSTNVSIVQLHRFDSTGEPGRQCPIITDNVHHITEEIRVPHPTTAS